MYLICQSFLETSIQKFQECNERYLCHIRLFYSVFLFSELFRLHYHSRRLLYQLLEISQYFQIQMVKQFSLDVFHRLLLFVFFSCYLNNLTFFCDFQFCFRFWLCNLFSFSSIVSYFFRIIVFFLFF